MGVPHQLTGGEYNERRSQCQAAAAALGVKAQIAATIQGILGARLTGGGFGGATSWLVEGDKAQEILSRASEAYHQKTGATCKAVLTKASQGARLLGENRPSHDS